MSKVKHESSGTMLILIDDKKGTNILGLKNLSKVPTAFQAQVYDPPKFQLLPDKGIIAPKQVLDLEMAGAKPETSSFHIVCLPWPANKPTFETDVWRKVEKTEKDQLQVISFGRPPTYTGIRREKEAENNEEGAGAAAAAAKSSGPKLLVPHTLCLSYKIPEGKRQSIEVNVKNVASKPVAFKLMTNRHAFYAVAPTTGIIELGKAVRLVFELKANYTKKDFDDDKNGHEFHLLALKWPKLVEQYRPEEWNRLEKARKDQKQRVVFSINHKGDEAPPLGTVKSSAQLTSGPRLLDVTPTKIMITAPMTKIHTIFIKNEMDVNLGTDNVAFKIQTNQPKFYIIKPIKGLVKAGQRAECKMEVNENLTVKDMTADMDNHQLLITAIPWKLDEQKGFDNNGFTAYLKMNKKGVQKICIDLVLDKQGSLNSYASAFPPKLSFQPPNGTPQTLSVTVVNKIEKVVAFRVEPLHPIMLKFYSITPDTGILKGMGASQVSINLNERVKKNELPTDPTKHGFKLTATPWPTNEFNEDLWRDYQNYKKGDLQVTTIPIDFETPPSMAPAPSGQPGQPNPEMMMKAMMMMQQMQGGMMMPQGMEMGMMPQGMGMMQDPYPEDGETPSKRKNK